MAAPTIITQNTPLSIGLFIAMWPLIFFLGVFYAQFTAVSAQNDIQDAEIFDMKGLIQSNNVLIRQLHADQIALEP